ncbi:MAG: hypothetical protein V3R60_07550 [Acidobacteriota bacterium]
MEKYDIETPAPLVDRVKMERNIRRMVEVAQGADLRLRPHTKTHKCPANAKIQLHLGTQEIAVAKIGEKLEIVTNHVCQPVNQQDTLNVVVGTEVVDAWRVEGRGETV